MLLILTKYTPGSVGIRLSMKALLAVLGGHVRRTTSAPGTRMMSLSNPCQYRIQGYFIRHWSIQYNTIVITERLTML